MPVDHQRSELRPYIKMWDVIRDCVAGEQVIKGKKEKYLPRPNAEDNSIENTLRYNSYLERAVFYNVTKRTLGGMTGQIFSRDPVIKVTADFDIIIDDATGTGVNLIQLSKAASEMVIGYGRGGIFIDYPQTAGPTSIADRRDVRPTLTVYDPWSIINWRTIKRGGRTIPSLVILKETYVKGDDEFQETLGTQYRALRLINDQYQVWIYREEELNRPYRTFTPLDADERPFNEIPFKFIGAQTNDTTIDEPPMYDLASLNVGHYRNSADYEESAYIVGQPTPYFAGLTENWVKTVLKDKIQLGSRAAVPLPEGGTAGLLQPDGNSLPFEAMKHKERQMVALGARLVETIEVQRTATETGLDYANETSILSMAADNVSDAITDALIFCGRFMGVDTKDISFALNTEFDLIQLSAQDRQQLISEWQAGIITFEEARFNLRRAGIVIKDDDEVLEQLKKEQKERDERERKVKEDNNGPET